MTTSNVPDDLVSRHRYYQDCLLLNLWMKIHILLFIGDKKVVMIIIIFNRNNVINWTLPIKSGDNNNNDNNNNNNNNNSNNNNNNNNNNKLFLSSIRKQNQSGRLVLSVNTTVTMIAIC